MVRSSPPPSRSTMGGLAMASDDVFFTVSEAAFVVF
jgi:hypothetical protein